MEGRKSLAFNKDSKAYAVVKFKSSSKEGTVSIVSQNWLTLDKEETFWPMTKNTRTFNKLLIENAEPEDDWDLLPVEVYYETFDYQMAREKARHIEDTSKGSRLRKKPKVEVESLEDSDVEVESLEDSDVEDPPSPCQIRPAKNISHRPTAKSPAIMKFPPRVPRNQKSTSSMSESCKASVSGNSSKTDEPQFSAFETQVISILNTMKEQNALILERLCQLTGTSVPATSQRKLPFEIPVNSIEELRIAENLLVDDEVFQSLVDFLSSLGPWKGKNCVVTTNNALRNCLSDSVASELNFCGRGTKCGFGYTLLCRAVVCSVQIQQPKTSAKEIEDQIKSWLRHAPARCLRNSNGLCEMLEVDI